MLWIIFYKSVSSLIVVQLPDCPLDSLLHCQEQKVKEWSRDWVIFEASFFRVGGISQYFLLYHDLSFNFICGFFWWVPVFFLSCFFNGIKLSFFVIFAFVFLLAYICLLNLWKNAQLNIVFTNVCIRQRGGKCKKEIIEGRLCTLHIIQCCFFFFFGR